MTIFECTKNKNTTMQSLMIGVALSGLVLIHGEPSAQRIRYDDHKVLRFTPHSTSDVAKLHELFVRSQNSATANTTLDFWQPPSREQLPVDVRCSTQLGQCSMLENFSAENEIELHTLIDNLQPLIDDEVQHMGESRAEWTHSYHEHDEIINHFRELIPKYEKIASLVTVGRSHEGREILAVKIHGESGGDNSSVMRSGKPVMYMEALIHAREWITGASMYWIIEHILSQYGTTSREGEAITRIVEGVDMYFTLVTNPDGYVYTQTDRMWRKTRSPNAGSTCVGTDPNRNWDFHWCEAGTSQNPCSDQYCGRTAASEIEVESVQTFITKLGEDLKVFVDFHAYSQLWLTPWGWTADLPPRADYDAQQACAKSATDALERVHGTKYTYGPVSTTIYPASGSSLDYAYGVCGVQLAFGPEGRDTGRHGFLLPASEIVPSGEENLQAVLAMAEIILHEH